MRRLFISVILTALACQGQAADSSKVPADAGLAQILNFEGAPVGNMPAGWRGGPPETIFPDGTIKHSGQRAVRIERTPGSPGSFSSLTKSLPLDFAGKNVELRGFLRTEEVSEFAGLWMREDGLTPNLAFDNMQQRQLRGTTEWTEYSITLPVHPDGRTLYFGVLLGGTGKVWADDLQMLVDGKPVWEAPKAVRVQTILERDHEFDAGSKIVLPAATPVQIGNLAILGQVWGFLKYHHPKVTAGTIHWDYELFRIMPAVLAAGDRAAASAALVRWIDGLGKPEPAKAKAKPDKSELHLRPDDGWIEDEARLGKDLSERLRAIRAHRLPDEGQFYVSLAEGVGNPVFAHEPDYPGIKPPDAGYQLLGLFRWWNIIHYWYPYRDLLGEDWGATLTEFIPRIGLAPTANAYQLEMMALIARVRDTHANLWSSLYVRPPAGGNQLPVTMRFIENRAVVTGLIATPDHPVNPLRIGDVILELDGVAVADLVKIWSPYYAASNEPTRLRDMAQALTRGPPGSVKVRLLREGETTESVAVRLPMAAMGNKISRAHDLPGETFRLLSKEVAYLKLSSVKTAEVGKYVERAAGTKGLIIDIRKYPAEFVVFALGSLLVDKPTEFVRFTYGDLSDPGAFHFTPAISLQPQEPHYPGKVVILVDEESQSQAEYTTMAFRVAPGAKVIGSTTAGADGNVSDIPLPGGLRTLISGIGVFYPDKRPTQRVGIIPDVEVTPTLGGIRAGRDEVLEEALRQILGREVSEVDIRRLVPAPTTVTGAALEN